MAETTTEKSRDQQINDLATRVAQEFKTVKNNTVSVNTQTLTDAQKTQVKTNLGITDVNTSTLVPKTGNRGVLAGYETPASASSIDGTSNDANYIDDRKVYYPDTKKIEDLIKKTLFLMGEDYKDSPLGRFYDKKTSDNSLTKYRKQALEVWPE